MLMNEKIAGIFYDMADILEMQNVQWKPIAYRRAARSLEALKQDVKEIYKKGGLKSLDEIPEIGEGISKKIVEYIETGKIKKYEELKKTLPKHMTVLLKVPGMGPKKAKKLNDILKISTLEQLKKAAQEHKIAGLQGFGEKSEQDILENLGMFKKSSGKMELKKAQMISNKIVSQMKKSPAVDKIEVAGSVRRKKSLIRDLDIVILSSKPKEVIEFFTKMRGVERVIAKGGTKATVLFQGVQADIRVFPAKSWGSGLFYFTGSKNFNIQMRKIAIKKGYKLNEYGLFEKKTGKMIAGKSEEEICRKLGVKWVKPEEREV